MSIWSIKMRIWKVVKSNGICEHFEYIDLEGFGEWNFLSKVLTNPFTFFEVSGTVKIRQNRKGTPLRFWSKSSLFDDIIMCISFIRGLTNYHYFSIPWLVVLFRAWKTLTVVVFHALTNKNNVHLIHFIRPMTTLNPIHFHYIIHDDTLVSRESVI